MPCDRLTTRVHAPAELGQTDVTPMTAVVPTWPRRESIEVADGTNDTTVVAAPVICGGS